MVDEATRCLAEGVVKSADDIDFALLSGAGFPAFRGGLMRWARTR
jgi:3-hydroxyacyl-CoA dehydrogenase/enoyl-CoA hydratase/3-hydroxybutyryl-CoA epimerase